MNHILRFILASLAILAPLNLAKACTGTAKTQSAMIAEITNNLPNNASNLITPPILAQVLCDVTATGFSRVTNFLSTANTWVSIQTYNANNFALAGSTSGFTLLNAQANASGTVTIPSVTDTAMVLGTPDQVQSGGFRPTTQSLSTGNVTVDCGSRQLQSITNGGAFTITAPTHDGSCQLEVTNNGTAGAITFSGFSVNANTGDSLTTTNTNSFSIFIWEINGTAGYRVAAQQ